MRAAFHEQLAALTTQLADMCGLAGSVMEGATQAFLQADLLLAEHVITENSRIAATSARGQSKQIF